MASYAKGKFAFGFCDRTGFRYPMKDLVNQIENNRPTGKMIGRDMIDEDQPQLQLGRIRTLDPQALRNARPDTAQGESRKFFAFDPVGGGNSALGSKTVGLDIKGKIGNVTVSTS